MDVSSALGIATTLQNKVGQSFSMAHSLLRPDDLNSAMLQAGAVGANTNVLGALYHGQQKLFECTENIASLIQEQVDMAKDKERKEREALAEADKEKLLKNQSTNVTNPGAISEGDMDGAGFNMGNLLSGGLGAIFGAGGVLATGAALRFAKGLGKGLLKGGFYATMASFLTKPIIDFVEEGVLKYDIPEAEEEKMETAIIAAVTAASIFGPKGAIIALLGVGLKGVYDVLTDPEKDFSNLTGTEIASLAIGTIGTGIMFSSTIKAGLKAVGFNTARLATMGGLIAAPPFIIAGGLAIAAGVGAKLLADKVNDMEQTTLDHLDKLLTMTQDDFEEQLKTQEADFLERNAPKLKALFSGAEALTLGGQNVIGTQAALDDVKDKGIVDESQMPAILEMAEKYSRLSQKDLMDIMMNKQGMDDLITISGNLRTIALKGGLGKDSKAVSADMLKLGDKIKRAAGTMLERNMVSGHHAQLLGIIDRGDLSNNISMKGSADILEKVGVAEASLKAINAQIGLAKADLENAKVDRLKIEDNKTGFFGQQITSDEEEAADDKIRVARVALSKLMQDKVKMEVMTGNMFNNLDITLEDLKNMFTPDELKNMIKSNMMTGAQQLEAAMTEFRKIEGANPHGNNNIQTDIKTNNQSIKQGDVIAGHPHHSLDGHLQGAKPN